MRYNSGIYSDIKEASKSKAHFVELGLVDAFVTVYYNGKRIPLNEAKQMEEQARNEVAAINENKANPSQPITNKTEQPTVSNNKQPVTNNSTDSFIGKVEDEPATSQPVQPVVFDEKLKNELTNSLIHNVATPDTGIVYKIKIGAFKDDVPVDVANKFLKMKTKGSINFTTENGITVYTLGNFKDAKEATKIKSDVDQMNLKDVSILSYSDGKKLSDDKTNELINQH